MINSINTSLACRPTSRSSSSSRATPADGRDLQRTMILRKPTAIPLRPQDLQEFQDHLRAQQEAAKGTTSREGSAMTVDQEGDRGTPTAGASGSAQQQQQQQQPVDATEVARRTRAQMTARQRVGLE